MIADIALATALVAAIALIGYVVRAYVTLGDERTARAVGEANQIGNQKLAAIAVEQANAATAQVKTALDEALRKVAVLEKDATDAQAPAPGRGLDGLRGLVPDAPIPAAVPGGHPAAGAGGGGPGK